MPLLMYDAKTAELIEMPFGARGIRRRLAYRPAPGHAPSTGQCRKVRAREGAD